MPSLIPFSASEDHEGPYGEAAQPSSAPTVGGRAHFCFHWTLCKACPGFTTYKLRDVGHTWTCPGLSFLTCKTAALTPASQVREDQVKRCELD